MKRRVKRAALTVAAIVIVVLGGGGAFLRFARPVARPASPESVERTPERLARGTYLVENLLPCTHCHSEHDVERWGMPVAEGAALAGGPLLDRKVGLPGVIQSPNITPDVETGIGGWSDGELMRALREGIHRDGHALFPSMPYAYLRAMSDEDVRSVVVYLRAAKPVRRKTAPIVVDFPVSLFVRTAPAPVEGPVVAPDPNDAVKYGGYLVQLAVCHGCHTAMEGGRVTGEPFAGGREFPIQTPRGTYRSVTANITPDPTTGYFGRASKDEWIARVRAAGALRNDPPKIADGQQSMMPWLVYAGLTDQDLAAIYDFMKTVPPVKKLVTSFPDATPSGPAAQPTAAR